jgi:hypothetical protein
LPEKNFNRNSKYWIICFPSSSVFYLWLLHNFRIYGFDGVYRFFDTKTIWFQMAIRSLQWKADGFWFFWFGAIFASPCRCTRYDISLIK